MNIKRVKYKMNKSEKWKIGYIIGKYDGDGRVLLDEDFNYIPKIKIDDNEYLAYDYKYDINTELNITLPL